MFNHLIGNAPAKLKLERLLKKGRVPNSLLFAGPEGVGKRQFAIELAKSFLCREPADGAACGLCPACKRAGVFVFPKSEKGDDFDEVFFSEHPDLGMVIPFRRNVRIGAIRALEREANFRPYESSVRFFIVDDAEKMADPAANALLKTLEEPATTTYIILITSRPNSLMPTIRSRCQSVRFAPVATGEVEEFLINDRAFSRDEARVGRASSGSVGRAVSIKAADFARSRDRMLDVLRNILSAGDLAATLKISEEMNDAKNKEDYEENLDILESLIHDVWSIRTADDENRLVNSDLAAEIKVLAGRSAGFDLAGWLAEIETMRSNFIVNINRKVATDALFVTMGRG